MNSEKKSNTTIDSSILVSMFVKKEEKSNEARSIVHNLVSQNVSVILPNIVLIEVVSAIIRRTRSKEIALSAFQLLKGIPNFKFINVDSNLTEYCCKIAVEAKLKNLDTIILSTALMHNSKLLSFDKALSEAYAEIS
ncbi:MAG: PIN domain-containing protein [Melioribacteraceae bacterium]|nr:PIN domain-containing protein [Melioribacteraceae bacterium]